MISSFERRNGNLSASERDALNQKAAQVLLSLGYQSTQKGKLPQALKHYTKAFRIAPGWSPLRHALRALGSVLIPLRG
jgi:Tfp pilus assembly protein PilF